MSANTTYYVRRKVVTSEWVVVSALTSDDAANVALQDKRTVGIREVFHWTEAPDEVRREAEIL